MEMKRYIVMALVSALSAGVVGAQDLHGSVTVQGQYQPVLRSHTRISPQPTVPSLSLPESQLSVATEGVPTQLQPLFAPQQAYAWNASKEFSRYPGYLVLGGGSYLDFTGSAGYRFIDNGKATLGAWLQHSSTSGYKPETVLTGESKDACASKRFDERIGLYGSYLTPTLGTVGFDLAYHLGYFNYYSTRYLKDDAQPEPPTQTLNDFIGRVWWQSPQREEGLDWSVELSDRYFRYRRYYAVELLIPDATQYLVTPFATSKENNLELKGNLGYGIGGGMRFDLGVTGNYIHYSDCDLSGVEVNIDSAPSSYGRFALTPAFNYSSDAVTARLGVRLDFTGDTGNAGEALVLSDKRFGHTHFAPDVTLSYRKGKLGVQFDATGGVELRTLASTSELFYYQSPQLLTTVPIYSPLNAKLAFNFGSFGGFSMRAGVAYKVTDNTTPDFMFAAALADASALPSTYYTMNVKGFSLQAGASYKYGETVKLSADLSYQPQDGDKGYFNGYDRPRWILDAAAEVNPWSSLRFKLAYQYRGVRNLWYRNAVELMPGTPLSETIYANMSQRLDDLTNLSLGAEYTFSKRYTLWLNADNLLNRNTLLVPGMPTQGLAVTGGFSILF